MRSNWVKSFSEVLFNLNHFHSIFIDEIDDVFTVKGWTNDVCVELSDDYKSKQEAEQWIKDNLGV